jgi:hypothetical protein
METDIEYNATEYCFGIIDEVAMREIESGESSPPAITPPGWKKRNIIVKLKGFLRRPCADRREAQEGRRNDEK